MWERVCRIRITIVERLYQILGKTQQVSLDSIETSGVKKAGMNLCRLFRKLRLVPVYANCPWSCTTAEMCNVANLATTPSLSRPFLRIARLRREQSLGSIAAEIGFTNANAPFSPITALQRTRTTGCWLSGVPVIFTSGSPFFQLHSAQPPKHSRNFSAEMSGFIFVLRVIRLSPITISSRARAAICKS